MVIQVPANEHSLSVWTSMGSCRTTTVVFVKLLRSGWIDLGQLTTEAELRQSREPAQCGSGVRSVTPAGRAEDSKMHEPVATVDGFADRSHGRFRRELAVVQDVRPGAERLADPEKHVDCLRRSLLIDGQACCF